ncbi:hypothetical protein DFS34DRAFT_641825 [Phlyctochytrium arcticum]|nr:hypothetical protein DFS34DRAFT_641825 [Phlyctochytrium arcticum]
MRVGERSRFLCMPEYTQGYVQLAKVLRQEKENRERATKGLAPQRVPMGCAHNMHQEMENQSDLAELNGVVLEFEIELLEVLQPDAYVREPWEMETMDKYREAPLAKDQGGQLYKAGKYKEALEKYTRALALLESVSMSAIVLDMQRAPASEGEDKAEKSEKTETELDLETLNSLMKSCRLNYAACNLKLNNLPPVIQQCSEVLKGDPKNLKALFRRGQAYSRLGRDLDLAQVDFDEMQSILDLSGLPKTASEWTELRKEQLTLQAKLKDCREREKRAFGNMFS